MNGILIICDDDIYNICMYSIYDATKDIDETIASTHSYFWWWWWWWWWWLTDDDDDDDDDDDSHDDDDDDDSHVDGDVDGDGYDDMMIALLNSSMWDCMTWCFCLCLNHLSCVSEEYKLSYYLVVLRRMIYIAFTYIHVYWYIRTSISFHASSINWVYTMLVWFILYICIVEFIIIITIYHHLIS